MDSFITNPTRGSSLRTHNDFLNEEQPDMSRRPRALGANFSAPAVSGPTRCVGTNSGVNNSGPEYSRASDTGTGAPETAGYFADLLKAAALLGTNTSEEATDASTIRSGAASSDTTTPGPNSVGSIRPSRQTDSGMSSGARNSGARPAAI